MSKFKKVELSNQFFSRESLIKGELSYLCNWSWEHLALTIAIVRMSL